MNGSGHFHRRLLLAEARRHLALVQRGRRRRPGLDEAIVEIALAEHCTDITKARTTRGREPGYRLYTARWEHPTPPARPPATLPGRDHKPTVDLDAPCLPLKPGEWDIPRMPLRHDRAVIAARVLTSRLRTARRSGRPLYGPAAHQPTALPEQLFLFTEQRPAASDRSANETPGNGVLLAQGEKACIRRKMGLCNNLPTQKPC